MLCVQSSVSRKASKSAAVRQTHGFTLVELSIVLVILGLLVGGVLTGQSLIRAAELRSISTQYSSIVASAHTFRDKYFALPGDMANAQSFWGVAHATPATCATTASTSALTCNGDGNGQINYGAAGSNEMFRFWQHLANAGLIEGTYSGITQGSTAYSATTANSPRGKLGNSLWYGYYFGAISGVSWLFNGNYGNVLGMGAPVTNDLAATPILKNEELWNIDSKIDDGKPATGKMVVRLVSGPADCTDTGSISNMSANYLLANTTPACTLLFREVY